MAVPDFTDQFNTKLSPSDEKKFQTWLKSLPEDQQNTYDYDLRGAFKAGDGRAANGHFPDTFKKPNHPTFSNQSKYSGQDGYEGGTWKQDPGGTWSYIASPTNLSFRDAAEMANYFQRVEPTSTLLIPRGVLNPAVPQPRPAQGQ